MAAEMEPETDVWESPYVPMEDTLDTDQLTALREPVLEGSSTLRREKRKMYDMLVQSKRMMTPHYVKENAKDDLIARARLRICRSIESLPVRVLTASVLVTDIVLVILQLSLQYKIPGHTETLLEILTLLFSACFCVEVSLRIIGQGVVFFRRWFEVLDLAVIVLNTLATAIFILVHDHTHTSLSTGALTISIIRLLVVGRLVRVVFWVKIYYEQKSIQRFIRSKVSQNRRRYTDENYDLDLTYVTDRVIAMSFPASGSAALYRNSISEVSQFLDHKHPGHYRVYNLCSEREYDTSLFHHQVMRISIDDHNVPKFTDLVDFCEDVYSWMEEDEENVVVVHCKGGKGRTGTMVAAWLVRSGLFQQARESLAYFNERRTDKSLGQKDQGVDTPSQNRYVSYYERLLTELHAGPPPTTHYRLVKMAISGITKLGQDDGREWRFEVYLMRSCILQCSLASPHQQVEVTTDPGQDVVEVVFSDSLPLVLTDDVKLKFYCSNKSIPTGSDKCQFYFWFHTTFIQDNRLYLTRNELDNMQKSWVRCSYPLSFSVELLFQPWTDGSDVYESQYELVD